MDIGSLISDSTFYVNNRAQARVATKKKKKARFVMIQGSNHGPPVRRFSLHIVQQVLRPNVDFYSIPSVSNPRPFAYEMLKLKAGTDWASYEHGPCWGPNLVAIISVILFTHEPKINH